MMLMPFVFTRKSIISHLCIPLSGEPFQSPTNMNYRKIEILNNKAIEKQILTAYTSDCTEYVTYMTCQFIPLFFGVFYINLRNYYSDLTNADFLKLLENEIENIDLKDFTLNTDNTNLSNIQENILEKTYNDYIYKNLCSDGYYNLKKLFNLNPFDHHYYTNSMRKFISNHYINSQSKSQTNYNDILDQLYSIAHFLESQRYK